MSKNTKETKKSKEKSNLDNLKTEMDVDFHTVPLDDLLKRFGTNRDRNRHLTGSGKPKTTPEIVKFLKTFLSFFSLLLIAGGILCFIAYLLERRGKDDPPQDNLYLGIVLSAVVLITGIFSYYQESKSSRIMDSFKRLVPQESLVLRNGKKINVKAHEVVVGDIVFIRGGDLNPADMRVIESKSFKVDNSSLTGESEPQKRGPDNSHASYIEAENMVFSFTYCVDGTGKGLVVAVGDNTLMGRIAKLTSQLKAGKTPIGIEIEKFIKLITAIAFVIGFVFFTLSITINKIPLIQAIVFLIGIIVANVPEGLLMTVTVALTLCAKKMSRKNCLVKNLESVETLGSTSVICSDKTGTLTQNRMTVSHLWSDNKLDSLDTSENAQETSLSRQTKATDMLIKISALCNKAEFRDDQDFKNPIMKWLTNGDASESALIKFVTIYQSGQHDRKPIFV
ncbi:Sodium/potassium-transporting ATPase subunit alpha-1 [Thelohanellus kitauei]|uniref:Sodium/potassium-transporting ATPase subunit alpha-1 n=1 Tax=Thelohanellus kitauei TaxID=669202 RepID=A0A0C2N1J7_THEKT|nr:Sodium/potassium-transporting ATPase subunit alpha-1 [Thelohanellus kitauei]